MKRNRIIIALGTVLILGALLMPRRSWALPRNAYPYAADIATAERNNGIPPMLLARLLYQESRFRPDIINGRVYSDLDRSGTLTRDDAQGIAQIVPRWHPDVNPLDPRDSIYYAGDYLASLHNRFGSWAKALAGYNWGPGNVQKAIDAKGADWFDLAPAETRAYVTDILGDVSVIDV